MNNSRKKLAAKILNTSPQKVRFETEALGEIQKAITRSDIRGLIAVGKIYKTKANLQSHAHARKMAAQKRKGRRQNRGSKKGKKRSTVSRKQSWMTRIRLQRSFIKELKDKGLLTHQNHRRLYSLSKGGYFRNKRHIKLYITEHNLIPKKEA